MKVVIDKEKCQGHAMCHFVAGEVYELDEHGYNRMDPFVVPANLEAAARKGARACPEGAIRIVEED